jgi:hypothetical protein
MLNVIVISVNMLNIIWMSVIMLNVVAPVLPTVEGGRNGRKLLPDGQIVGLAAGVAEVDDVQAFRQGLGQLRSML